MLHKKSKVFIDLYSALSWLISKETHATAQYYIKMNGGQISLYRTQITGTSAYSEDGVWSWPWAIIKCRKRRRIYRTRIYWNFGYIKYQLHSIALVSTTVIYIEQSKVIRSQLQGRLVQSDACQQHQATDPVTQQQCYLPPIQPTDAAVQLMSSHSVKTTVTMNIKKLARSNHNEPYTRLVGWGLTALLTQNRSYSACRFVGIFYSKL